jgi:hypothetical protein
MLIAWCLKGVAESATFTITEARAALTDAGLRATWLLNSNAAQSNLSADTHPLLSKAALDAHVNGFTVAAKTTPYLSLSAGCRERVVSAGGIRSVQTYPALKTALSFATRNGRTPGYVFHLWVLVAPKPVPELPGFGEEVRSLLASPQFVRFHHEGEIAAKLYVPARQIKSFTKYDEHLIAAPPELNADFVEPDRINNVIEFV